MDFDKFYEMALARYIKEVITKDYDRRQYSSGDYVLQKIIVMATKGEISEQSKQYGIFQLYQLCSAHIFS